MSPAEHRWTLRSYGSILVRAVERARADNITTAAAALAYYGFLAIPSALLVVVGVFGVVAGPGTVDSVVGHLGGILPPDAQNLLRSSLVRTTEHKGTGVVILFLGSAFALWSLTGAMQNVMWGLNIAYEKTETRGFVRKRVDSLIMVAFAGLGFVLLFGLLVLGPHLSRWVGEAVGAQGLVSWVWWVAEWPILAVGLLFVFAGMYYIGPNLRPSRVILITFGAVVAAVLWLAVSGAFAFYASRFGSYNKTWGALSGVVVMLTWLWLGSVALLLGGEVNAEVARRQAPTRV